MHSTLHYREGHLSDLASMKALGLAAYGQYAPAMEPRQLETMNHNLSQDATWISLLREAKSFVCEAEGQLVGMVFLLPSGKGWDMFEPAWSYVRMLGVHPSFQGRGIAKTLMQTCITEAAMVGEHWLALHTSEMMQAAIHIYEGLGFRQLREIDPRLGKRYWLYLLDLPAASNGNTPLT